LTLTTSLATLWQFSDWLVSSPLVSLLLLHSPVILILLFVNELSSTS
jgi:hypothetical protein